MTIEPQHTSRLIAQALKEGAAGVLATVVKTEGSTYRKPGAMMFVPEAGDPLGLLSGGCLEDIIANEAREVGRHGDTKLLHFDLMQDGEYLVGYGKGCFGKLWILLEPLSSTLLPHLADNDAEKRTALIYECQGHVPVRPGQRVILEGAKAHSDFSSSASVIEARVVAELASLSPSGKAYAAEMVVDEGIVRYCVHATKPPVDLVVFGAGPDARPLVSLASELGWHVRVFDHRPAHVVPSRFPGADLVELYQPSSVGTQLGVKPHSAAVLMTHNLLVDAEILRWAARAPELRYIGVLGPAARMARIYEHWDDEREELRGGLRGRLRSPIGLALGGAGEADIALAVIAEIQAWREGASACPMSGVSA